jgi:uncharacterized protein (UPF0332 family)
MPIVSEVTGWPSEMHQEGYMPTNQRLEILQRVSTTKKKLILDWKDGVSIESRSKSTIDGLCLAVTADRMSLAGQCYRRACRLHGLTPPLYRDAISRYYYAIYHAFRAVAFFKTRGNDFDDHSTLGQGIPHDFPDADVWRNNLKIARTTRNSADYDAYPKSESAWRRDCETVAELAKLVIPLVRRYLTDKGCHLK